MSDCLLVHATWCTAKCVALAILIGTNQLVNDVRVRARGCKACIRIYMPLQAFIHETHANSEVEHYTAELQDRASLQAQSAIQFWLDCGFSYKRLSQLALDLVVFPAFQAYV